MSKAEKEPQVRRQGKKYPQYIKTRACVVWTDDWEVIKEDVTDVHNFMGEYGGTGWFPGYLPVTLYKPCGKMRTLQMMYGHATLSAKAVGE